MWHHYPNQKLVSTLILVPSLVGPGNRAGTHFKYAANLKTDICLDLNPWFQVGTKYIWSRYRLQGWYQPQSLPKLKAGIRFRWYQEQGWYPLQICCQPKSWYFPRSPSLISSWYQVQCWYSLWSRYQPKSIISSWYQENCRYPLWSRYQLKFLISSWYQAWVLPAGTNLKVGTNLSTSFQGGTRILAGTRFEIGTNWISI